MPLYNLIELSDNYLKISGSLRKQYRDEPAADVNSNIGNFSDNDGNNSACFKNKQKMPGLTGNDGTKYVQIIITVKYLSNFWRTLEMSLIYYEINLILTWSENCFIIAGTVAN